MRRFGTQSAISQCSRRSLRKFKNVRSPLGGFLVRRCADQAACKYSRSCLKFELKIVFVSRAFTIDPPRAADWARGGLRPRLVTNSLRFEIKSDKFHHMTF
jgi:hypothetical protein